MCGIAGIYQTADADVNLQAIHAMLEPIEHRGPDGHGVYFDADRLALGHRRLSIIDLSELGKQPMTSSSGRYVITYNGEIYNYRQLAKTLEQQGMSFTGHSDTEVLLAAIEAWGIDRALQAITGMFAFALWDKETRKLVLARDRFGEKPLYYGQFSGLFLFGSELKCLRAYAKDLLTIDRNVLPQYMQHSYIATPYSIYENVAKLTPGCYLEILADGSYFEKTYWSARSVAIEARANPLDCTEQEAISQLKERLLAVVGNQMISDVPLGAFLSGGIDSSLIVSLMQAQSSRAVKTFSIGFEGHSFNEANYAKEVAQHLKTEHIEFYVQPEDVMAVIPKLPSIYDEPFADSSQLPTYLVSQLAKRHVTVSLTGDSGDEVFGGYNRYFLAQNIFNKAAKIPYPLRSVLAKLAMLSSIDNWNAIYKVMKHVLPKKYHTSSFGYRLYKLAELLQRTKSEQNLYQNLVSCVDADSGLVLNAQRKPTLIDSDDYWLSDFNFPEQMMLLDTVTYMRDDILTKVDRAAMAVSLETRVPFLDHDLFEFAWRLPYQYKVRNGQGKWILRQLLYQYVPKTLIDRPKAGFGIPVTDWLKGPLKDWMLDLLDEHTLKQQGYLDAKFVTKLCSEHLSGRRDNIQILWNILMFQAWLEENG